MPVAAPITEDNSTALLRKMVWNSYDLAFNVAPVIYTNTAFISSTGDDDTAELNNPDLPYATLAAAITALLTEYPGEEVTVRILDDAVDFGVTLATIVGYASFPYVIIRGHGGVRTASGTLSGEGPDGDPPDAGLDVVLWDIALSEYVGTGGDNTGSGNGANGGDVYLIGGASVTTFTSDGGAGDTPGAAGRERTVMLYPNDEPMRHPDDTFMTYP